MIIRIILSICILPMLPILYIVYAGVGKEQNNSLFGVALWKGALKEERVQKLTVDYKKQLKWTSISLLVLYVLVCLPSYFSIMMALWMLWVCGSIFIINIPYIRANKRLREFKREYQLIHGETMQNNVYVDLTAATEEKPKYFQRSALAACIACFLPVVIEVVLYKKLNSQAAPELWVVELVLISIASIGILFLWMIHYYNRQPVMVITTDSQVNMQFSRIRKYQWSRCFHGMIWSTALFGGMMLGCFYLDSKYMILSLVTISVVYCLFPFVLCILSWQTINKQRRKLLEGRELLLPEDDDNWIGGMFYYNKSDSRFMVEKRVGIGTTVNMAKPSAKIIGIVTVVFTIVVLVGTSILLIVDEFTPVELNYENHQLIAHHVKEEYRISKEDIVSVTLLEEIPKISKQHGTGMDNVNKGTFFSRAYERRFKVCLNPEEEPVLMIEAVDGTWYLLGDSQSERTKEIYEKLIQ